MAYSRRRLQGKELLWYDPLHCKCYDRPRGEMRFIYLQPRFSWRSDGEH